MSPCLRICILIIFLITPAASKEVAYVYGDGGGHSLENINLTEHNDTYIIKYIVGSIGSGASSSHETNTTVAMIKSEIKQKINKGNDPVRTEGRKLVGDISGLRRIDQICSIYDSLVDTKNWTYVGDWTGLEELQYSNKSLELGKPNRLGKGDCDDFSILLAALLESVQATPRIIFAYGPAGGHAYAQVYLGKEGDESDRMIDWMKTKYKVSEINTIKNETTEDVWLNLDWWKDPKSGAVKTKHPGGPFFSASEYIPVYPAGDELENPNPLTPVPVPPISKFSISNANPNAKENVTFDASESRDVDTQIKAWDWDFGDGNRGSGQSVTHAYSQGGRYNVTLTVIDDDDMEKSSQSMKTIDVNGLPIPIINYAPKYPNLGQPIDFDGSQSYDSDKYGNIKNYYWDFGDGETSPRKHPSRHEYETNGTYTISLTVEDNKGAKNTTSIKLKANLPPKAIIRIEPPRPPIQFHNNGDEVKFNAHESIDPDGYIKNWHWDFGDETNSTAEQASHIYSKGGEFTVRLNVTDDNNASDENSKNIKVNWLPVPIISIDAINGLEVKFNGSKSFDPEGGPLKHEWDFENDDDIDKKIMAWTNRYPIPDKYTAKLKVIDENGASNSTTITINLEYIEKPSLNMTSIKINIPNSTELVPVRAIVSGKSRKLEPAEHLWTMVNPYAQINLWWPQEEIKPENDGSWDSKATIGGSPGDIDHRFDIAAIIVDESENKKIKEWTNQGKSGMPWNESWKKQDIVTVKLRAPNVGILSPTNGTVLETFEVNGTSEDPVPGHLWLVVSPHKTPGLWYPQGPNPIKVIVGKWHQIAWIKDADMYSDIAVVLVNEETNKSFTKWHKQGEKTQNWTGLFLPTDTWIGPIIEVIRNQPPILISLSPDIKSPQEDGSVITWEANASDSEGDRLLYQFLINGKAMTDWMSDNTWTWNAGKEYLGTNQIEVWVRDGKHVDADRFDDRAVRDFEISIEGYSTAPINNSPPIAKISYDIAEPTVEDTIMFDASDSYDNNGSISRYDWHFEDESNNLHGPHQPHKFPICGSTKVVLTVFDNENASNSTTVELMVRNNPREKFSLNHDHGVISVVFSPDGTKVVTASDDNTARIWNASSGQKLFKLPLEEPVYSAQFSPDGTKVVTASDDNTARIWNASSGQELFKLLIEGPVHSAQFSPDGTKLVTTSGQAARIWNASSGQKLCELPYEILMSSTQFSHDGTRVVTRSRDHTARIWNASSGQKLCELPHEGWVNSAQFSPDGTKVVTAGINTSWIWDASSCQKLNKHLLEDGLYSAQFSPDGTKVVTGGQNTSRIWDASSGQELFKLPHEDSVHSAQFSPDGTKLVTTSGQTARIWNASSGQKLCELPHKGQVISAQFSPDGTKVVTASMDETARIWDASSGRPLSTLTHEGGVFSAQFSPDGTEVVTASIDETARIWDVNSGRELSKLSHEDWMKSAVLSPDGTKLAIASNDGKVLILSVSSSDYEKLAEIKREAVVAVVFSQDGTRVATVSNGTLRIWDASSGKDLVRLPDKATMHDAVFSPDGTRMASACYDNSSLCIWSGGSGREIRRIQASVNSIVFSPDGTKLAAIRNDSTVRIWEASSGKELVWIQHDETGGLVDIRAKVNSMAFSPDGKMLATASDDNTARVWEVSTGNELVKIQHEAAVKSVVFSPDGTELATTSSDNTARIWDARSGKELARIQHEAAVKSVVFSLDGTMLATASDDNTSQLWDTGICPAILW
jgi:WD40 repeat protein